MMTQSWTHSHLFSEFCFSLHIFGRQGRNCLWHQCVLGRPIVPHKDGSTPMTMTQPSLLPLARGFSGVKPNTSENQRGLGSICAKWNLERQLCHGQKSSMANRIHGQLRQESTSFPKVTIKCNFSLHCDRKIHRKPKFFLP